MKKIIEWVKESNHYLHICLLAALALLIMSVGAFEFGADGYWKNVWQTTKFGLLSGLLIEVYQALVARKVDWANSLGDLLADVVGLGLGLGLYGLLAVGAPASAIMLLCGSAVCCILSFAMSEHRYALLAGFLGCLLVGLPLFVYV